MWSPLWLHYIMLAMAGQVEMAKPGCWWCSQFFGRRGQRWWPFQGLFWMDHAAQRFL